MNTYKTFSIGEALRFGFSQTKEHFGEFFKMAAITVMLLLAIIILPGIIFGYTALSSLLINPVMPEVTAVTNQVTSMSLPALIPIFSFFGLLWFLLFQFYNYQLMRYSLLITENRIDQWQGFFNVDSSRFWKYLLARFWYSLKAAFGLVFFIIPGLYLSTKYVFSGLPILDNMAHTVGEDVHYNRNLTRGILWKLFGFVFLLGFLTGAIAGLFGGAIIGFTRSSQSGQLAAQLLSMIIGTFVAPIISLAMVHVYKQLDRYKTPHHIDISETHPRHT